MAVIMISMLCYLILNGAEPGTATVQKEESQAIDNCSNINLDFTSAAIHIYTTEDSQLKVVEKSNTKLKEEEKFVTAREGDSVYIEDGNKDKGTHRGLINIFNFSLGKSVEVYIPKGYSKDLTINATSGSVRLEDDMILNNLQCKNTSGSIKSEHELKVNKADINNVSGSIELEELASENYNIRVTSGAIRLRGLSGSGDIASVSGSIEANYKAIDEYSNVKATSGSIRLKLDKAINFDFQGHCTSGSINGNIDMNYEGKRRDTAEAKVGESPYAKLNASVVSGSIRVDVDK